MSAVDLGVLMMTPVASAAQWRDRVRRVDDSGAASLQVSDHFDRSPISPLVALAAAATHSERLRLGTLVLNNDFRQPAVLAKEVASLQLLCAGRLELGIGAGWMEADYAGSGITRAAPGRRVERLTDTVRLLRASFGAAAEPVDVAGEYCSVSGYRTIPPIAVQPSLLIGGGSRRVLTLAGQHADIVGVNFDVREGSLGARALWSASEAATAEKVGWVRAATGSRTPVLHLVAYWAEVTEHPERAAAARIAALGLDMTPAQMLASPHSLIGPAGAVREKLAELKQRWGFGYVTVYESDLASMAPAILN
ncbi:MAG TPA: TIGR03621 family F420-dependent LLM class oxidoreductase [Trebonia sp.]|nr:TIGR03621 family F420-dependent LLM class oxidoreductase [Trebonia sp.]